MTERPIIFGKVRVSKFKAQMVRAILEGRKTQTRRVMKIQPASDAEILCDFYTPQIITAHGSYPAEPIYAAHWNYGEHYFRCPYGAPGDTLWVREGFATVTKPALYTWYRAGHPEARHSGPRVDVKWRPSIHMPRWASRITLEVKNIRVERLQDISEDDARAEGCIARPFPGPWWEGYRDLGDGLIVHQQEIGETPPDWMIEPKKMPPMPWADVSARDDFRGLWNKINGPGAWASNPWVWVVQFERVKP